MDLGEKQSSPNATGKIEMARTRAEINNIEKKEMNQ